MDLASPKHRIIRKSLLCFPAYNGPFGGEGELGRLWIGDGAELCHHGIPHKIGALRPTQQAKLCINSYTTNSPGNRRKLMRLFHTIRRNAPLSQRAMIIVADI